MKHTSDWRGKPPAGLALPEAALKQFAELEGALKQRSQIVWGEHCTECAFPACYASCAFYTPRADFNCRRFENGIEEVAAGTRFLNRIRFRKWGKLEGKGPLKLVEPAVAAKRESDDRRTTTLINLVPSQRVAASLAWRTGEKKEQGSHGADVAATESFVIEAWLGDDAKIPFTLTITPADKADAGLYQEKFTVARGYNRMLFATKKIASQVDVTRPFLIQIEPLVEAPPHDVVFGLIDFATFKAPVKAVSPIVEADAKPAKTAKCVIWDLDNTVWAGTLAEDGVEGLTLKPEAVAAMKALDARGILNAVASKNDPEPALAALVKFGIRDLVLFPQIGWGPKSDSVRNIAQLLDIGLDTFVFIDDQPFERAEVGETLPMVRTLAETEIATLLDKPYFDVPVTAESGKRRLMYQDEERRHAEFAQASTDYLSFLRGCRIVLEIARPTTQNAERLYELSQRTNQLNFSASRLTREEVNEMAAGTHRLAAYVLRVEDRFGDYGIIGLVLVDASTSTIEGFYMSCRVQRKRVEQAFFAFLAEKLAAQGHQGLRVKFRKSAKNGASVRLLDELGFTGDAGVADGEGYFARSFATPFDDEPVVKIVDLTIAPAVEAVA